MSFFFADIKRGNKLDENFEKAFVREVRTTSTSDVLDSVRTALDDVLIKQEFDPLVRLKTEVTADSLLSDWTEPLIDLGATETIGEGEAAHFND